MELEPEQIELLVEMVEAEREIPREHRRWFLVNVLEGSFLEGPDHQRKVIAADLQELTFAGYLRADIHDNYTITPKGRAFYAEQQKQTGAPAERADAQIRRLLDGAAFRAAYPGAHDLWVQAEDLLWVADSENELTTVGHKAREAMQRFATEAVERYKPENPDPDPTKVNKRIGVVIAKALPGMSDAVGKLLMALGDYSEATVNVIQRQEHGEQKVGAPLEWTDARRVVLSVALTMFEVASVLEQARPPER